MADMIPGDARRLSTTEAELRGLNVEWARADFDVFICDDDPALVSVWFIEKRSDG